MKNIIFLLLFFSAKLFSYELPELGSSFDNLFSIADEKKIKFQILQQVYASNSVIRDTEVNDYLNNLGKELQSKGTLEKAGINFFIVNDSSINAFAMLGNIIGVHSGLLLASNSESELASVLSHEIAHISQKHLLRLFDSQAKNSYKSYLAIAIAILAARSNPQLASGALAVASASQTQNILDYTRENEKEADRIGLQILSDAGYDPKGFIDFFSTLQKFNSYSSGPAPVFLRTHPITTERISDIQDRLSELSYMQKKNRLEFYFAKAKLKATLGDYNEISNEFFNDLNMKRFINEPATYFGLIYSLLRQNKVKEARKYFKVLSNFRIDNPMLIELNAQILINENKYNKALQIYNEGLKKYPYYRAFIHGKSKLLIYGNKPDDAIEIIKKNLNNFSSDPEMYRLLAKAYNIKKKYTLEHENLSDANYFEFNIQDAITQMDMAVRANSSDFFDQSRVEYRLKELKREYELMNN